MPTYALLYLATLLTLAVVCIALWGPIGALVAIPTSIVAIGRAIARLR